MEAAPAWPLPVSSQSILVADSDAATHQLLSHALHSPEMQIESAFDAQQALKKVREKTYGAIVMDASLADGEPSGLLQEIRSIEPRAKVLLTAGSSVPATVINAIRRHAFSFFSKPLQPVAVAEMVTEALRANTWEDDIELLSGREDWITIAVRCKIETVTRLVQFIREIGVNLEPEVREDIAVAFRELLLNAIEHGGRSDQNKRVRVSCVRTSQTVICLMQDPGEGFSLQNLPHAAISNPPDSPVRHIEVRSEQGYRPGGFGILLTRSLVDELIYSEQGNEVLFVKYIKRHR